MAKGVESSRFQMGAVPSTFQKPVSGGLAQNGHHEFLDPRKSYRRMHERPVREMLGVSGPFLIWEVSSAFLSHPQSWGGRARQIYPVCWGRNRAERK